MKLDANLLPATFVRRDNRFRAAVRLNGEVVAAHVANPGRMTEMFEAGRRVYLAHRPAPHRVTDYDLALIEHEGILVSADTRLPTRLFGEALESGRLPEFGGVTSVRAEVPLGTSRIDYRVEHSGSVEYVEVKSVTLIEDGCALFPDAPTIRGARHVRELAEHVQAGGRAAVAFVVQREDALKVQPFVEADPDFAAALRAAADVGVRILAYRCHVAADEIRIVGSVPVVVPDTS